MGILLSVSRDEKESLLSIMWFEDTESMRRALGFEVLSMRACHLSSWVSRSWLSLFWTLSKGLILFLLRREVISSRFFFMQACSRWKPFLQCEHLTFSFPWWPLFLFFFEPEGSSCCWFWTFGLGDSNLVLGFFYYFPFPFKSLGLEAKRAWSWEHLMIPIWTSLSCSLVRDSMKALSECLFHPWVVRIFRHLGVS